MSNVATFVGLDYHVSWIQVCLLSQDGRTLANRKVVNDVTAVAEFIESHGKVPSVVALEACAGSATFATQLHEATGWNVRLADAGAVRATMRRGGDKTDHADAFQLADLARVDHLPEVWLPDEQTRQLRRLVRYREQLVEHRREVKQHVRGLLHEERALREPAAAWSKAWLEWVRREAPLGPQTRWVIEEQLQRLARLDEDLERIEARLQEATAGDPLTARLLEEKGVGIVTAVTLRAEIGTFERFGGGKQLARYCGVTPCNRSSGKRQADAGLVRQARNNLRVTVIETAQRLGRWDPQWKALKAQLMDRGKPASVATAAVANRWIRRLFYQVRSPATTETEPVAVGTEA
jgi:transposase